MLWTRADLSFALVNNLELLTHYTKRAENERCFSRQNRDEKKTEMGKNIRVVATHNIRKILSHHIHIKNFMRRHCNFHACRGTKGPSTD